MHFLQEKFQITVPAKEEAAEPWASFASARNTHGTPDCGEGGKFNLMPPGMDGANTMRVYPEDMPLVMSGQTDESKDTNAQSFTKGFTKRDMKGTDDQYTGEHIDHFYGDAGGFVERNNYLDRE